MRNALRAAIGVLLVAIATATYAAPPPVELEALTWTELRDRIRAGDTTILVPVGATEQSGPHLVLGKHNRRVALLAERIAQGLGHAIVAPVIAYVPEGSIDPPTSHMRFPGTISVPPDTFVQVLDAAGRSFKAAGFRDIVFLGDHGGYQKELQRAADRLNRTFGSSGVRAHAIVDYYRTVDVAYADALRARGYTNAEIGRHAGLADTSLALAVDPSLVREDRMKDPSIVNRDGVDGDPRRSSAELGRIGVDLVVARTTDVIRKAIVRR